VINFDDFFEVGLVHSVFECSSNCDDNLSCLLSDGDVLAVHFKIGNHDIITILT